MGFVDRTSHLQTSTITARHDAGFKRPRAEMTTTTLILYNPSAADKQQHANAEEAGALVPFVPSREPIDAVPLSAAFPKKLAPDIVRAEPPWLRTELLPRLEFRRHDLPVCFIAEKAVTATDLVPHQNRFRLPTDGVTRNLWPLLSPQERNAANMLHEEAQRPQRLPKLPRAPGEKATKRKGKKHGRLPVQVVEPHAGRRKLQLARWDSSGGTVIKGDGYLDFINRCGFEVGDVVEIWAFKESYLRLFGVDHCQESHLHLLIAKKGMVWTG